MPAGAIYVGRPTRWGNPFRVTRSSNYHGIPGSWFVLDELGRAYHPEQDTQDSARQRAVDLFAATLSDREDASLSLQQVRAELAGHDLVCWCPTTSPCHADVLLAVANGDGSPWAGTDKSVETTSAPAPPRSEPHERTGGRSRGLVALRLRRP